LSRIWWWLQSLTRQLQQCFHHAQKNHKLKLKFLLLFCLGNITHQALTLAIHIKCKIYQDVLQIASYFGITWLFHILQTTFI
jgi:hypothetical protein